MARVADMKWLRRAMQIKAFRPIASDNRWFFFVKGCTKVEMTGQLQYQTAIELKQSWNISVVSVWVHLFHFRAILKLTVSQWIAGNHVYLVISAWNALIQVWQCRPIHSTQLLGWNHQRDVKIGQYSGVNSQLKDPYRSSRMNFSWQFGILLPKIEAIVQWDWSHPIWLAADWLAGL